MSVIDRKKSPFSEKKEQKILHTVTVTSVQFLTISENDLNQRIDNYLFRVLKGVPKSLFYRLIRNGQIRVNKKRIDQTYRLQIGDIVRIPPINTAQQTTKTIPKTTFDILYEDNVLLFINKPAGVAVHGGSGVSFGVIEQLRASRPNDRFLELVHRLDKETSGILVIAKKRSALTKLHEQIRDGSVDKRYQTLVHGDFKNKRQHIKLPLLKYLTPQGERRVRVDATGLASHTIFNVLDRFPGFTLLEAELKTGRTHQIRVHLSSSGFAIAGDDKYGDFELNRLLSKEKTPLKRMFLHAYQLTIIHPETNQPLTITAPLPDDCQNYLYTLKETKHKNHDKK